MTAGAGRQSFLPPLWIITLLVLAAFGWLLHELREIVVLLVIGYSISYVLEPGLRALERVGVARPTGVFLLLGGFVLFVVVLFLTAIPTILREYRGFVQNWADYLAITRDRLEPVFAAARDFLPEDLSPQELWQRFSGVALNLGRETLPRVVNAVGETVLKGYSITLTVLNLFLLPFIVFYLSVDFPQLHRRALELFPLLQRRRVRETALEINQYVSAFIRGQLTVGAVLFLLYAAGLGIIGVQLWALLGFIAGFGNFIPYLGTIVGIVLSTIMAIVTFGDLSHVLQVWILFALVQFLEGTFITPKIVGDKVGLSPLVIILAVVAGGSLFGLLGILLAVPGVAALRVLLSNFHEWVIARV